MALLILLSPVGCATECRSLCTAWYDYLRDVCQELDTDDDRVRCISDYRSSRVSDVELGQCTEQAVRIAELSELPEGQRECLCDGDASDCDGGDDDDSAP